MKKGQLAVVRAAIGQQTSEIDWLNHAVATRGEPEEPHE
jgi:hypothetical protein